MRFLLTFSRWSTTSLINARGDLDVRAAHVLRVGGEAELEDCPFLVVDASRVTTIDDHGVCTLLALDRIAARRGGWTRLSNPSPAVRRAVVDVELTDVLAPSPQSPETEKCW